jgi:hypothetical protein
MSGKQGLIDQYTAIKIAQLFLILAEKTQMKQSRPEVTVKQDKDRVNLALI